MVAERAVQQLIDDLRGELGVKFREIEQLIEGNKSEADEAVSDLAAAMTDAFKQNNATLRNEMQAIKGDITQQLAQQFEKMNESIGSEIATKLSGNDNEINEKLNKKEKE